MRTPSEHKIDTFSLREDGRKDTRDGMDSLNYVDFVGRVEWRVLGLGESYYVLPSHPTRVRGLKLDREILITAGRHRTPRGCAD